MAEAGVPGVVSATDYALYAPAGTPNDIIMRLNREVHAVLQMPTCATTRRAGHRNRRRHAGIGPAELLEEIVKWGRVIAEAKLKPE